MQDFDCEKLVFIYTYAKICLLCIIHDVHGTRLYKCALLNASIDQIIYNSILKGIIRKICISLT